MKHKKNLFWLSIILFVAIFIALPLRAQVTIGDETSPQTYSVLELISKYDVTSYGGLRLPQLTTAQRDGLDVTPSDSLAKGLAIYNTDNNCVEYWNDTKWLSLCSGSASTIIINGGGSDPFDPNNPNTEPNDPGSSLFPKDGGEKGPFTPDDSPACTAQDLPYQILLITGGEYSKITVLDASTGEFKLAMEANSAARVRYAIVRVVNNCTGAYRDFTYTQDGQNIGIRPDLTQSPIPAPGGQFGPYTPEVNPEACASPDYSVATDQPSWCTAVIINTVTGEFYLIFQPNPLSTPRYVNVTVTATNCGISSTCKIKQSGVNVDVGEDNYPAPDVLAEGGDTKPGVPNSEPRCDQSPNNYIPELIFGNAYATLVFDYEPLGIFHVNFSPNPSTSTRTAVVRVTNPCNGLYTDFTYTQAGSDCAAKAITATGTLSQSVQQGTAITQVQFSSSSAISLTGSATGITVSGTGSNLVTITGTPTVSGTYSFVASTGNAGCADETKTFLLTVTVDPCSTPPTAPTGTGTSRCGSGTVTLSVSGAGAGENYKWYNSSKSFLVADVATYSPNISATTTYYVSKYNTLGCETAQGSWLAITATVNPIPSAGTISGGSSIIVGSTLQLSSTVPGGSWTSSNTSAATISSSGLVTGIAAGSTTITYTVTGTGGCTNSTTQAVTVTNLTSIPIGAGTFKGKTCFDIAESNDNATCATLNARKPNRANFNLLPTYEQTYTFTPSGTVSKVRFYYIETNGAGKIVQSITPTSSAYATGTGISTACTAKVVYKTSLSSPNPDSPSTGAAKGLTAGNALTVDIYVVYNDQSDGYGDDKAVKLTASIKDCACCGAATTSGGWLNFKCHNLGANESLDPFTYVVGNADGSGGTLGYLFQWGRKADGHEKRNSGTTTTQVTITSPHGYFVTYWADWLSGDGATNDRWGDGSDNLNMSKGANDPCPTGWKVPSQKQWQSIFSTNTIITENPNAAEVNGWTWTGNGYKVGNALYLPAAGYRPPSDASLDRVGTLGRYWSSTAHLPAGFYVMSFIQSAVSMGSNNIRTNGQSIRCVQE